MYLANLINKLVDLLSGADSRPEPLAWPTIQSWIGENLRAIQGGPRGLKLGQGLDLGGPMTLMELRRNRSADGEEQVTASFGFNGKVFDPVLTKTWSGVALAPDLRQMFADGDRARILI